jgi:hypothetical protein
LTDLSIIIGIYQGSNGEATKMLYRDLEAYGPIGKIAVNLFRAAKCSERAKMYRKGRGYKTDAYARKDWSIKNLTAVLDAERDNHRFNWGWAIDEALQYRADPHHHILYVDLPTGQISFHVGQRYDGPDFDGKWDGVRDVQAQRVCRFVAEVFKMSAEVSNG